jgi:TorA maturation chaperone TorD
MSCRRMGRAAAGVFAAVFRTGKCWRHPWASVYLSKERLIFDENTLAVRRFYRDWKLETVHYKKEPDDHIGLELEFMAILSERTLAAYEKGDWELYGRLSTRAAYISA